MKKHLILIILIYLFGCSKEKETIPIGGVQEQITEEISEGEGTMAYGTTRPLNAFVDICLNKNVANHSNSEIGLKTVKVLDAIYRSIKSEQVEKI